MTLIYFGIIIGILIGIWIRGGIHVRFNPRVFEYHYGPEEWDEDHTMCQSWMSIKERS